MQAGADDASGTTYYFVAADGDAGIIGWIANTSGTFAITDGSDEKLKKDIVTTEIDCLAKIKQLRVVDYKWAKIKKDALVHQGFIAQEMQKVFPNVVSTGPDGFLGVSPAAMVPYLTKGVQQLEKRIQELEKEVEFLKAA